jgi:hypothetical protein
MITLYYAIIEVDDDRRGFSGVSWHATRACAERSAAFYNRYQRQGDPTTFIVVNSDEHRHFSALESLGMLFL